MGPELSLTSYQHAWAGIALACAYYLFAALLLRFSQRRSRALVIEYEPPPGISPAIAALIWGRGRYERAFAAAFIALASKGFLKIEQSRDAFCLHRLRQEHEGLPPEETAILNAIVPPGSGKYCFDAREYGAIDRAFDEFRRVLAKKRLRLITPNSAVWLAGIAFLLIVLARALASLSIEIPQLSLKHVEFLYLVLWMVVGGSCFVAALHAWAATGRKLISYIPGVKGRHRPLDAADFLPIFLTASALLGFAFLGSVTSPRFAGLAATSLFLIVVFRPALESPTAKGRRLLAQLRGFREFVARAEASRFNFENSPGRTPEVLEKFTAYAVALDVERGWGEELAESMMDLLQFDEAYRRAIPPTPPGPNPRTTRTYPPPNAILELGISAKRVSD